MKDFTRLLANVDWTPFFGSTLRAEVDRDPLLWCKCIRTTLIAIGYPENYINDEFRDKLEEYYRSAGYNV